MILDLQHIITKANGINSFDTSIDTEDLEDSIVQLVCGLINDTPLYFFEQEAVSKSQDIKLLDSNHLKKLVLNSKSTFHFKTSGTTGTPKLVIQTLKTLANGLIDKTNLQQLTWGFSYSTRHISGILLMLQALTTNSNLVDLRNLNKKNLTERLNKYKVTNISAPSTFYRLNFPLSEPVLSVKKVTNGGEPLSADTLELINTSLPKAEVRNIYASTEFGSLLVSNSSIFTIPEKLKSLVKIEDDILFVHKRLVSTSEILNGDWYSTKDSIEWVTDTTFKIKGRISEDIKVMGHLVSLRKIESLINGYDGVKMCKLIPKVHNVFGNLLICQLLLEDQNLELKQLKQSLKSQLRNYEMPSKFIIVDNIEMTASGKIKR